MLRSTASASSSTIAEKAAAQQQQQEEEHLAAMKRRFPPQPTFALSPRAPSKVVNMSSLGVGNTTGTRSAVVPPPPPDRQPEAAGTTAGTSPPRSPTQTSKLCGLPIHTVNRAQRYQQQQAQAASNEEVRDDCSLAASQSQPRRPLPPSSHSTPTARQRNQPAPLTTPHKAEHRGADHNVNSSESRSACVASDPVVEAPAAGPVLRPDSDSHRHDSLRVASSMSTALTVPHARTSMATVTPTPSQAAASTVSRHRSANTLARVERSEKRKELMSQQLALERTYWTTKYTFRDTRIQAERRIYQRELTALWAERTDRSPYWHDQTSDLHSARTYTEQWRRRPEYVKTAAELRREVTEASAIDTHFSGVALSILRGDVQSGLDHHLVPPLPPSEWKTAAHIMYEEPVLRLAAPPPPTALAAGVQAASPTGASSSSPTSRRATEKRSGDHPNSDDVSTAPQGPAADREAASHDASPEETPKV